MIKLFWHLWHSGHSVRVNKWLSVSMFDPGSRGWLYHCECGYQVAR